MVEESATALLQQGAGVTGQVPADGGLTGHAGVGRGHGVQVTAQALQGGLGGGQIGQCGGSVHGVCDGVAHRSPGKGPAGAVTM